MRSVALALALLAAGCSVTPSTDVALTRTLPDGSTIEASIERTWQGGPVSLRAEYDPASQRWIVEWQSDVQLEEALAASEAQLDAQRQTVAELLGAVQKLLAAGGLPVRTSGGRAP